MKKINLIFSVILALLCAPMTGLLAADLDDYYLERFGKLKSPSSAISGATQVTDKLPFEKCYTPVYHSLRRDLEKLQPETRKTLASYLSQPALASEAQVRSPEGHFIIHYATTGSDAPPLSDINSNGIPDWVETVASVFEAVYSREVIDMGYTAAPVVGGQPYDVYLQDQHYYLGYTKSDVFLTSKSASSYIVIDNDYSEFGSRYKPLELLMVTAAHEYHHAIQYGYNYYFDIWYAEATSTWIEDEVFDSVNQLYAYLQSWFDTPRMPLDTPDGGYERWLFNRYLAEVLGTISILQIWELLRSTAPPADGSDINMLPLINSALGGKLDEYLLGLGNRVMLGNWLSHRQDLQRIGSFVTEDGTALPLLETYPSEQYSFAFLRYSSQNLAQNAGLNNKPAAVAAVSLNVSSMGVLLLCNNVTGSSSTPVDPLITSEGVPDAIISTAKSSTLISGPAINSSSSSGDGGGGGGCFIATAAYGSYLHPKVMVLRGFRDRWLLTNPVGRMLVSGYYRVSPSMAHVIARHGWMRRGARALLSPVIATVEHPESVASCMLGLLGWGLIRRRVNA